MKMHYNELLSRLDETFVQFVTWSRFHPRLMSGVGLEKGWKRSFKSGTSSRTRRRRRSGIKIKSICRIAGMDRSWTRDSFATPSVLLSCSAESPKPFQRTYVQHPMGCIEIARELRGSVMPFSLLFFFFIFLWINVMRMNDRQSFRSYALSVSLPLSSSRTTDSSIFICGT